MAKRRRDGAKEAYWRKTLQRFAASGLSGREFCRREKLAESAFYAWRRTIGERNRASNSEPAFVPAVVRCESPSEASIAIELAGGRVLRLSESISANRLAELVHALEARGER
jgi:transposase-like protein